MYSNNILNFQESMTILNACTKKSRNLLKAPHIYIKSNCANSIAFPESFSPSIPIIRGVMVIVAGIGHGDTSSNPGLIAFYIALIPLGKV